MSVHVRMLVAALFASSIPATGALAGTKQAAKGGKIPITTASEPAREAFLAGRDLLDKLRVQQARGEFEKAVQHDPSFALGHLNLANTQPTTKQFFASLDRAMTLASSASKGEQLLIRGAKAGADGDNVAQVKVYEELVASYPQDERALNLLGTAHFGGQRWAEAIVQYEKAVKIEPRFSAPYNQMGYAYRFLEQPAKAEAAFKKYIELIPDDPNPYDSYAELLLDLGRFEESIANYKKALAVDPTFIASHLGIATDLDLLGRPKDARQQLDTMLASAADDGQRRAGLFAKTVSYAHEGNFTAAQQELDRQYAIAAKTDDVLAMNGDLVAMGNLALESGDVAGAEKRYRRALEIVEAAPNVAEPNKASQQRLHFYRMARVALANNDLAGAKSKAAEFAAAVAPTGSVGQKKLAHELAGQVALAEKRWDTAIQELALANQQDPYNIYRQSLAYAGKGDAAKAKELAQRANNDNTLTSLNYAFVRRHLRGPG